MFTLRSLLGELTRHRGLAAVVSVTGATTFLFSATTPTTTCVLEEAAAAKTTTTTKKKKTKTAQKKVKDDKLFHGQCLERQMFRPTLPYPLWNYDWDGRMRFETTLDALSTQDGLVNSQRGTKRHIILIRHGQYDETSPQDEKRKLTDLGRRQAELTGKRLAELARGGHLQHERFEGPCRIKAIHVSNMTRAKETAEIIAKYLPDDVVVNEPDPALNEALPAPMIPIRPDVPNAEKEIDENHDRIEAAFHKYFYRSTNPEMAHDFEIIVGHGNVIRYFLCRAMQLPPEAWLRIGTFNCSITYITIAPNGYCSVRMVGDVGHLSYEETTFSHMHGFNW